MSIITVSRGITAWMVDYRLASIAGRVRELFGTTVLPLPFTSAADAFDVVAAVRAQHPDDVIVIGR
jgi:hypothetical protein